MKSIGRYGVMVLFGLLALLPGTSIFAQDNQAADCRWIYNENSLTLGTLSLDDCALTLFNTLGRFGLQKTYGAWGGVGLNIDAAGEVYSATSTLNGEPDWQRAGNINPANNPANNPPASPTAAASRGPLTLDEIFALVNEDINDFWTLQFQNAGASYVKPDLVIYEDSQIRTGCGAVTARMGPLYCPADHVAYFPRRFMENEMRSVGDFAIVVIIAHEWGHAVQNLAGLNASSPTIFSELQADCFAGAYSSYASVQSVKVLVENGDIDEGATALFLFGDPEGTPWFDAQAHGSGDQRFQAFQKGLAGDYKTCLEIKPGN